MLRKSVFLFCFTISVWAIPRPSNTDVLQENAKDSVNICLLPPLESPISCSGIFYRWTYNAKSEACEKYVYGGCHASANVFKNQYACLSKCSKPGLEKLIKESDPASPCLQPKVTGDCRAVIPSFYFDSSTGECTAFNYSGCDGNANNFSTQKACERTCYGPDGLFDLPPTKSEAEKPTPLAPQSE